MHHVVVLASAVDEYTPTDSATLATNPALEVAIGLLAVTAMWRWERHEPHATPTPPTVAEADRDPVIFAPARGAGTITTEVLLLTPLLPLREMMFRG